MGSEIPILQVLQTLDELDGKKEGLNGKLSQIHTLLLHADVEMHSRADSHACACCKEQSVSCGLFYRVEEFQLQNYFWHFCPSCRDFQLSEQKSLLFRAERPLCPYCSYDWSSLQVNW